MLCRLHYHIPHFVCRYMLSIFVISFFLDVRIPRLVVDIFEVLDDDKKEARFEEAYWNLRTKMDD